MTTEIDSIGTPHGRSASTCGYCSPPGERSVTRSSYHTAGLEAQKLSCQVYQDMIDRGWRRSGTWCYKPDLRMSCCPQYTIKLDALMFKPSKSQRKVMNRWNRLVLEGNNDHGSRQEASSKKLFKKATDFSFLASIHSGEKSFRDDKVPVAHEFEVILEPSSYTEEKYQLYEKYQREIHHDIKSTPSEFVRFLVESPLRPQSILYSADVPDHLPRRYGSYHQLYRLDGKLIAISVIDILPSCVSSVYFIYDKTWERFSLGKLSAMREVSLVREMNEAGASDVKSLYMGYYIHSCQKMRYKGEYCPSYLADPETYKWYPLETCRPLLDRYRYACFSHPEHSTSNVPVNEDDLEPDIDDPPLTSEELDHIYVVTRVHKQTLYTAPIVMTAYWGYEKVRRGVISCVLGLGVDVARHFAFRY